MSDEVVQWLAEIRVLKQELAQCRSELDVAYQSSARWRDLYSTEAKQRRIEASLARETANQLKAEIRALKDKGSLAPQDPSETAGAVEREIAQLSIAQCRQQLQAAMEERDRAIAALQAEQEQHQRTRASLTAVIGDTVEQLTRVRTAQQPSSSPEPLEQN